MLLNVNDDIEMPGGSAGGSAFAFVLEAQLLSGGDARRNLDRDLAFVAGDACRRRDRLHTAVRVDDASTRRRGTAGHVVCATVTKKPC